MTATVRVRLRVTGRVQGVGFRWFVREAGRRLALAGTVRNEPDGAVMLETAGPAEAIAELRRLVERGPDGAHVSAVEELVPGTDDLPVPFGVAR